MGIPDNIIDILKSLYRDTLTKYKLGDVESGWVRSSRGVRQGCILSPILFALFMEELTERVKESGLGVDVGGFKLPILLYADDVVLLAESNEDMQRILDIVD